jgi:hypothetical protein
MNEQILKASRRSRVAEFLQRPCEVPAKPARQDSIDGEHLRVINSIRFRKMSSGRPIQ